LAGLLHFFRNSRGRKSPHLFEKRSRLAKRNTSAFPGGSLLSASLRLSAPERISLSGGAQNRKTDMPQGAPALRFFVSQPDIRLVIFPADAMWRPI